MMYGNFLSNNKQEQYTMQGLAQSYTQDSQTKSDERTIMQVRNNQWLVIDRNVRIIVVSFHTYCQNTAESCWDDSDQDKQRC